MTAAFPHHTWIHADTPAFLQHIADTFARLFGEGNISLMRHLPEDIWLKLKDAGLLLPFLPPEWGGRAANQFEIQEVLRIAGHYGVPVTLRTGIEGALVVQPLTEFGSQQTVQTGLQQIFQGEGGGLAITEPATSGSAIAREMQSYFEYTGPDTIRVVAEKYWQGNSIGEFLLVAAKERKNGRLGKTIHLVYVPREHIRCEVLQSEGLKAVRYAVNRIDAELPAANLMSLGGEGSGLRAFQNIFIRSRLQLIGMGHGIMENIIGKTLHYAKSGIKFVEREISENHARAAVSQTLYHFVCRHLRPDAAADHLLMEANIVKTLSTDYTYAAAQTLQKLLGAKGFQEGHPASSLAIDFRPFTIFEGPNDMLYAEIYDQFARGGKDGGKHDKHRSLAECLLADYRFDTPRRHPWQHSTAAAFLQRHTLADADTVGKVFLGKILAKIWTWNQSENTQADAFLLRDLNKDILDFEDALAHPL